MHHKNHPAKAQQIGSFFDFLYILQYVQFFLSLIRNGFNRIIDTLIFVFTILD